MRARPRPLLACAALLALLTPDAGCTFEIIEGAEGSSESESGDGDGDATGDGDGDTAATDSGDGDGDGDPATSESGDGDGDATGDGDGDATGDGDGDALGPQLAVGDRHTCAARSGELYCWGTNDFGQLGYGNLDTIGDDELPIDAGTVAVGLAVRSIAAGFEHTCALTDNDSLRCWGSGEDGRLGYANISTIGDDETPDVVLDVPLGAEALAVDAGRRHTCALTSAGGVRCWGYGIYLGYGNGNVAIGDDETPAAAGDVELGGVATAISCGEIQSCALLDNGSLHCWGGGAHGIQGQGATANVGVNDTPAEAGPIDLGGPVAEVAAGRIHTCARLVSGEVRCWGNGGDGRLGYGGVDNIGDDELPLDIAPVPLGGAAIDIAAGWDHSCALLESGDIRCWGRSNFGQLGYGNTDSIGDDETPDAVAPVDIGGAAVEISVGHSVSCALRDNGGIYCWGWGGYANLGQGNLAHIGDDETPASVGPILL